MSAEVGFDPNATIVSTSNLTEPTPAPPPFDSNRTVASTPPPAPPRDMNRTVASAASGPTELLDRHTGPTRHETVIDRSAPSAGSQPQPPSVHQRPSATVPGVAVPAKKSKLPMIIGLLLLLLVLGVGAIAAAYFVVIRPRLEQETPERASVNSNENTNAATNDNVNAAAPESATEDAFVPPPGTVKFTNSGANLDGKLAEHYFDFSFYYPNTWQTDPKAGVPGASNFAKVERRIPPDFTQENFAVGWYTSEGTAETDQDVFPELVGFLGGSLAKSFPGYRKISEGPTRVNSLDGYEFRFESESKNTDKGDIKVWGRVVFLPPGIEGQENGATLVMLTTSLAPELSGVEDVGEKGQMPVILESFRFGKK